MLLDSGILNIKIYRFRLVNGCVDDVDHRRCGDADEVREYRSELSKYPNGRAVVANCEDPHHALVNVSQNCGGACAD